MSGSGGSGSGLFGLARRLVLGDARRHPAAMLLTVFGIALGSAVVVGIDAAVAACLSGFERAVTDLAGESQHRVVARGGGLSDDDFIGLRLAEPELSLTPIIDRRALVDGVRVRFVGVDIFTYRSLESIENLGDQIEDGAYERWQTEPGTLLVVEPLAASLGVGAGDAVTVTGSLGDREAEIVATIGLAPPANASVTDLVVADIATAQELLGIPGTLDRIEARFESDAERAALVAALPETLELATTESAAARLEELIAAYRMNLLALSMMAAFVAVFIVYNASLVGVQRRRDSIAALRAVGASPGQIARVYLAEAAAVGLVGGAIGLLCGRVLAELMVGFIAGTINDLYGGVTPTSLALGWLAIGKGMSVAVGSALLGAAIPILAASRVPPVHAMSGTITAHRSRRWVSALGVAGVASLAVSLVVWLLTERSILAGYAIAATAWLGFALATPALVGLVARAAGVLGRGRLPLLLAASDLRRALGIGGIAASAMMLAMGMNIAIASTVGSFRGTVLDWLDSRYQADLYVAPEVAIDHGIPAALTAGARSAIESELASSGGDVLYYRNTQGEVFDAGSTRPVVLTVTDLEASESGGLIPLAAPLVGGGLEPGGQVYVSQPLARKIGVAPGDLVRMPSPTGVVEARVRGVFHDFVADRGAVLMDFALYRDRWADDRVDAAHVTFEAGTDLAAARASWAAGIGTEHELAIQDHAELRSETRRIFDRTFRITDVLLWLSGLVAIAGLAGALLALAVSRRQEFAVLSAVGAGAGDLAWRLAAEAVLLGAAAVLISIVAGTTLAEILAKVIQVRSFGWTINTSPQPLAWAAAAGFALVGSALAIVMPLRVLSRTRPAEALRHE
ncbi:MAG: FtsX-like permease family protein [Planctomycetota bacterium]